MNPSRRYMATALGITGSTVSRRIFRYPIAAGLRDHGFRQRASHASAAKLRTKIKPLHLADFRVQFVQRDTTSQLAAILRQQQPAGRRGVIPGKPGKFLIETLKAQTEAERLRVLEKKLTGLINLAQAIPPASG